MVIYNRHFPESWHIAMVVRSTPSGSVEVGFFFREVDGTVHAESSYKTFLFEPRRGQPWSSRGVIVQRPGNLVLQTPEFVAAPVLRNHDRRMWPSSRVLADTIRLAHQASAKG